MVTTFLLESDIASQIAPHPPADNAGDHREDSMSNEGIWKNHQIRGISTFPESHKPMPHRRKPAEYRDA